MKSFADVVLEVFAHDDLMREYRRLYGSSLGAPRRPRAGIEVLVDRATGHDPDAMNEDEALAFIGWVREYVWDRLPPEAFVFVPGSAE